MIKFKKFVFVIVVSVISSLLASSAFAQSKSKLSAEQRTKNIERFWKENPDQPRSAKPLKDGGIVIPDKLLSNIRFGFEKRMALAGHGFLFDAKGRKVEMSKDEALKIQHELLEAVVKEDPQTNKKNAEQNKKLAELVKKIDKDLANKNLFKPIQRFALRHIKLRALSYRLSDLRGRLYRWRGDFIWRHVIRITDIRLDPRVIQWRDILDDIRILPNNDYVEQCRDAGVPIPPVWTPSSTTWGNQGSLVQNILSPGGAAQVWTWADPHNRGGCVALPRNSGDSNDVAGIICQNADNGKACIWDNIDLQSGDTVPWATEPLNVSQLEGAPQLNSNCTNCHSGNNVFLVAPDDPTWCKLLRGGLAGSGCSQITGQNRNNFTLQVEGNVRQISNHSTYLPLSGSPARAGWTNNAAPGCAGSCHLNGTSVSVIPMPPACGANCN